MLNLKDYPEVFIAEILVFQGLPLKLRDIYFFGIKLTKKIAASLLKDGCVAVTGLFSEKKGVFYDATVVLNDDGGKYVRFKLEFDNKNTGRKEK